MSDEVHRTVEHGPFSCSCIAVPLQRRMQTLSLLVLQMLFPAFLVGLGVALWYDLFFARYVVVSAMVWQLLVDGRAERRAGRPLTWVQQLPIFRYVCDYFPAHLHVEERLDPSKPYIISAHPHG